METEQPPCTTCPKSLTIQLLRDRSIIYRCSQISGFPSRIMVWLFVGILKNTVKNTEKSPFEGLMTNFFKKPLQFKQFCILPFLLLVQICQHQSQRWTQKVVSGTKQSDFAPLHKFPVSNHGCKAVLQLKG